MCVRYCRTTQRHYVKKQILLLTFQDNLTKFSKAIPLPN